MDIQVTGFLSLLIFIGDVWAILNISQSKVSLEAKFLWVIGVIFLPLLGLIIWFISGPKAKSA